MEKLKYTNKYTCLQNPYLYVASFENMDMETHVANPVIYLILFPFFCITCTNSNVYKEITRSFSQFGERSHFCV